LYAQAEKDFARYAGGLTPEQQASYRSFCEKRAGAACMRVAIVGGRLFVRDFLPGYQSRHLATLHAMYCVAQRFGPLADAELVIEVTDGGLNAADLPVFMITRPRGACLGILYPDFTFYAWPESVCPPERSHAYGYIYDRFEERARTSRVHPLEAWEHKADKLFWRGGRLSTQVRDRQVSALQRVAHADVAFMEWHSVAITGLNGAPGCVGLLDHCRYRYLAFLNGNTYSSRFKYQLLCGSCVFASRQPWVEWWSHLFRAGDDYIEVREDFADISHRLTEVRARADGGRSVAERGRDKALAVLSEDAVDCYWLRLLQKAAALLPPPTPLGASARPIEDVLLYPNSVHLTESRGLVDARQ